MSSIYCGIDLGTTYSSISWFNPYKSQVETVHLKHADGKMLIPSVVYYEIEGTVVVGKPPQAALYKYPERVIIGIKRSMGNDEYKTGAIDGKEFTPPEISAEILKVLKEDAEQFWGEEAKEVVISVPAYFKDQHLQATREAAELAGLHVLNFIPEPHAAAMAFAIESIKDIENRNIVVYDLGGGTFDVTLITTEKESVGAGITDLRIRTLARDGKQHLGGLDWDRVLAELVAKKAIDEYGIENPCDNKKTESVLLKNCEEAKRDLTWATSCSVIADFQGNDIQVTRSEFERDARHLVQQTEELLKNILGEAEQTHGLLTEKRIQELEAQGQSRSDLDTKKVRLLLCGGATRMPMIQDCVKELMGEFPLRHKNPDLLVTVGAAYQAYLMNILIDKKPPISSVSDQEPASTPLSGKQGKSAKSKEPVKGEPGIDQKPSPPPTTSKKLTAMHVIDMFKGLDLLVTEDSQQIEARIKKLSEMYHRMKGRADGQKRNEADLWFKNADRLKKDRPALLDIVYRQFTQLADAALELILSSGTTELSSTDLYFKLQVLATDQCLCDTQLAHKFVKDYLQIKGIDRSFSEDFTKRINTHEITHGIISLEPEVHDSQQKPEEQTELQEPYIPLDLSREKIIYEAMREAMREAMKIAQSGSGISIKLEMDGDRVKLLKINMPENKRDWEDKKKEPQPEQKKESSEDKKKEPIEELPPSVKKFLDDIPEDETYDPIRIQKFLAKLNLKMFCFQLKNKLKNSEFAYKNLEGVTPQEKSVDLVSKASDRYNQLGEVVFHLIQYYINENSKDGAKRIVQEQLHKDLAIFFKELWEQGEQVKVKQVQTLLEQILT